MKRTIAIALVGLLLAGGVVLAEDYDVSRIAITSMATNPLSSSATNDVVIKGDLVGISVVFTRATASTNSIYVETIANNMGPAIKLLALTNSTITSQTYYPTVTRCDVNGVAVATNAPGGISIPYQNVRLTANSGAGDSVNPPTTNNVVIYLLYNRR